MRKIWVKVISHTMSMKIVNRITRRIISPLDKINTYQRLDVLINAKYQEHCSFIYHLYQFDQNHPSSLLLILCKTINSTNSNYVYIEFKWILPTHSRFFIFTIDICNCGNKDYLKKFKLKQTSPKKRSKTNFLASSINISSFSSTNVLHYTFANLLRTFLIPNFYH